MTQKLKQWQGNMENNALFSMLVNILSAILPALFLLRIFQLGTNLNLHYFLCAAFYSALGNAIIFHQNKVLRLFLMMINIVLLLTVYRIYLIGGWETFSIALYSTVIPFFGLFH